MARKPPLYILNRRFISIPFFSNVHHQTNPWFTPKNPDACAIPNSSRRMLGTTCGNHFGRPCAAHGAPTSRGEEHSWNRCFRFSNVDVVHQQYVWYVIFTHVSWWVLKCHDVQKEFESNPVLMFQFQFWSMNHHFATEFPIFFLPKTAMFTARFILQQDPTIPCAPIADPRCQAMELEFWRNWDEKNSVFSGDELMKRYHAKCHGK